MDENQKKAMPLIAAYQFGKERGLQAEIDEIRDMDIEWDLSYSSSLRRGYVFELFEKHGIFDEFTKKHWTFGLTSAGEKKRLFYAKIKKRYEDFLAGQVPAEDEETEEESLEGQAFAAESDLRDFLADHLSCIEPGLTLYNSGDKKGVEFAIDNGFIDLLAKDSKGQFVVIELKVGKGRNKTVGQLLYYMGWVDSNLAKEPCRGMIIAKEIPDDLMLAITRVPGISAFRNHLAVTVEAILSKAKAAGAK